MNWSVQWPALDRHVKIGVVKFDERRVRVCEFFLQWRTSKSEEFQ